MLHRLLAAAVLLGGLGLMSPAQAPNEAKPVEGITWYRDPTCQLVFFAVLEGLYADGVTNDAVDLILKDNMREHFVYCCPLCHPAYEAFRLYRSRQDFYGLKASVSTFGGGLGESVLKKLHSDKKMERMAAIQSLIDVWVNRRVKSLRLSKEEQATLSHKMEERRKQGMAWLQQFQAQNDPNYAGMKFCPICEGSFEGSKIKR